MEGAKKSVVIPIFAVAMLRVATLKIRNFSCTRTSVQLYALLFIPILQPTEILDASTDNSDSGGDDEEGISVSYRMSKSTTVHSV
jgi:hypothetical protein